MRINAQIVGSRKVSYTNKAGNVVSGASIGFIYDDVDTIGKRTGEMWISSEDPDYPAFVAKDIVGKNALLVTGFYANHVTYNFAGFSEK